MVSRDGQKAILRQSMELVPASKLLYSSDGHWFPETYWLANKQFREVWLDVSLLMYRIACLPMLIDTATRRVHPERRPNTASSDWHDERHHVQQFQCAIRLTL